jgi:hypothetical protein
MLKQGTVMMRSMLLVASMFLGACATQTGWAPTVDTYGDSRAQYVSQIRPSAGSSPSRPRVALRRAP